MTFCRNHIPVEFDYSLCGYPLTPINNTVKYLGITMDNELYAHPESSCCQANKALIFLKEVYNEFKLITPLEAPVLYAFKVYLEA